MKDANAIRANAPFPKEKFISCITIEVIANITRVKMLTAITGGYDTVSDHLESLSTSVPEILTACRLNGQCFGLYG